MRNRNMIIGLVGFAVLAGLAAIFIPRLIKPKSGPVVWPTQGWPTSTPEEAGLDSGKLAEGLQAIQAQKTQLDSLMVIRDGKVMLDASFYPYNSAYLHDLASVTKSFTTTLIGIAIDQGKLKLDDRVLSFFPERTIANRDAWKEQMTVQDLVSMRNGFESGCLEGDLPTLQAIMAEPDWVQATLDRTMTAEPGTKNCYDSPGMHLLSAILQKATGMTELEFARQYLFEPLGIQEAFWLADPQGITRGWGDLHLKPADAAKLGYLWLNNGMWEGKRIVSAKWVKEAVQYHSDFGGGDGYGYGWWLWETGYQASGRGGQSVKVRPDLNVIVVTTGGGFDYDTEIDPYIKGAIVDLEKSLPANATGAAALQETLSALTQPAKPQAVGNLPATAQEISGKTFVFKPNAANLESLGVEFNDSNEAILHAKYYGSDVLTSSLGLDGIYRTSAEGDLRRGYWEDPQTFIIDMVDVGKQTIRIHIKGDGVIFEVAELGLRFEGKAQ